MRRATGEWTGRLERVVGMARAMRVARWRLAERLGRALLGGRLAAIDGKLDAATANVDTLRSQLQERDLRLTSLTTEVARLAGRVEALAETLGLLAETVARSGEVAALGARVEALRRECDQATTARMRHARSIRWLVERLPPTEVPALAVGPLVSVVMPVWNRAALVGAAIESVVAQTYRRWELLVVDDGSEDDTAAAVARHLRDDRIRYLRVAHGGEGRARNQGLAECRGEIVAYLDSDNTWAPGYLAAVVSGLAAHPECDAAYAAQLVADRQSDDCFVRAEPFDRARLQEGNYIDVNVFAHRRALVERLGGFDEGLTRLADWELILRYTAARDPLVLDMLGGQYALGLPDQVSQRRSFAANLYRVRRKRQQPIPVPVRVLYALWHYPQLSESYVRAEIAGMRRRGVAVEVWSETEAAAPFPAEVPIHRGDLADVIARVDPDVVHVHWLAQALACRATVASVGLPLTVRAHGFEFDPEVVRTLAADPAVRGIYLFPHLAARVPDAGPKVRAMAVCFDPDRYPPAARKDPRLVVRVAAGLPTKALDSLFEIARACPQHRVVLALARAAGHEQCVDRFAARNRELGSPVELQVDLQHETVAALVGEAGVYLHTHGLLQPYGMPMSIAEAMATGCHVIAPRCPPAEAYVGDAGRCYDTPAEAAALIRETATWDAERWHQAQLAAVERAYTRFTDITVLQPLLDQWVALGAERAAAAGVQASASANGR